MIHRLAANLAFSLPLILLATASSLAAPVPAQLWTDQAEVTGISPDSAIDLRTFSRLAKAVGPAVVNISVTKQTSGRRSGFSRPWPGQGTRQRGVGTGFIIHPDGYALTNHHVIEGATEIEIKTSLGKIYAARVVGAYPQVDVALLKITADEKLPVAALGDSDKLDIAEWVIAIGNPFGLNNTVTAGIVSAKERADVHPGGDRRGHSNFIQTDASINPGNSGGPLINTRGQVVGINTAINAAGQGIGFAVPINRVKKILPQLAAGKVQRAYLGVKIGPVPSQMARHLGLKAPTGALVSEVLPGTPAAKAGMRPGDVITHWDGERVRNPDDLSWRASTQGTHKAARLDVTRKEGKTHLDVRLTGYPGEAVSASPERQAPRGKVFESLGMTLRDPRQGRRSRMRGVGPVGLLITSVDRGSPSGLAGLQAGDVVRQLNYRTVKSVKAFARGVAGVASGDMLMVQVTRGERQIFVAFTKPGPSPNQP